MQFKSSNIFLHFQGLLSSWIVSTELLHVLLVPSVSTLRKFVRPGYYYRYNCSLLIFFTFYRTSLLIWTSCFHCSFSRLRERNSMSMLSCCTYFWCLTKILHLAKHKSWLPHFWQLRNIWETENNFFIYLNTAEMLSSSGNYFLIT